MSTQKQNTETEESTVNDIKIPIKRTTGETLEERLTANAYHNILPARYLKKDADGELVETQEDLFERVGYNVALAEAVYELERQGEELTVTPEQIKPTHHARGRLAGEVFGFEGEDIEEADELPKDLDDAREYLVNDEVLLSEENVNKFAYDTIVSELPDDIATYVEEVAEEYTDLHENLKFIANSPTLMNAGDDLQQLSACFVNSPDDDMDDIHETAKEAAKTFKSGGGMGYAFWQLRPKGDPVGSSGGVSSGPITFMNTFDQMCETVAQGGTRRGAQMGVMRVSHPDVLQFIHAKNKDVSLAHTLRLNDPDDYTHNSFTEALEEARELIEDDGKVPKHLRNAVEGHLSNFNISVGITDDFMQAVKDDTEYTFTNPRTGEPHIATEETAEIYEMFGYGDYVEEGEVLSVPAREIWDDIIDGAHENGEPGVIYLERANQKHSFDVEEHPEHRILATNPCVTGDTRISTANGMKTAEELYEDGDSQDVIVDSRFETDTIQEASSVYKTGTKEVYTLKTSEGFEIRLTADHRVKTDSGWVEAQNLESGDTVLIQDVEGGFGDEGTKETGQILGWLVGDGQIKTAEERATLHFYDEDCGSIAEQMEQSINSSIRPSNSNNPQTEEVGLMTVQEQSPSRQEGTHQRLRSTRLYELAEENGLVDEKLQVPDAVFNGSEEMASGFLNALFSADGGVYGDTDGGASIRLHSVSEDMLKQVQRLLLNFGIYSRIYTDRKESEMKEMPDGHGGTKEYETQGFHDLVIRKESLEKFQDKIGFDHDGKAYKLDELLESYDRGPYADSFRATVETVEFDGVEDVYDLTEPTTQSFVANGVVVHNCGEQPLEEYEACNLGHINFSTLVDENPEYQDFRAFKDAHGDEYASEEDTVEAFLEQALDWEEFNYRIEYGTRFLEDVVTMSDFPIDKIEEKVGNMRKIGLGIMGYAQMLVQLGIQYGSDPANEVARQMMTHMNHESKKVSHRLAVSDEEGMNRGVFSEWDKSKYADPEDYQDWFEHHTGEDAEDWDDGYPLRNHNTTTIAPTGTTSMVGNTTGGCEPMFNVAYMKNVSGDVQGDEMLVEFDDYFLRVLEANDVDIEPVKEEAQELMQANEFEGAQDLETVPTEIAELFITTSEISGLEHASVQCAFQDGVDSSISKTANFPNEATKEDMREVYEYIYENGGKGVTVYRDGTRSKQVLTTRADNTEFSDDEEFAEFLTQQVEDGAITVEQIISTLQEEFDVRATEQVDGQLGISEYRRRPDALVGINQRVNTGYGTLYVWISEDENGNMFEVFASIGKAGGYTQSFTEALCRMISMALRYGVPPQRIVKHLSGIQSPKVAWENQDKVTSVADGIAMAMNEYIDHDGVVGLIQEMRSDSETAERLVGSQPPEDMDVEGMRQEVDDTLENGEFEEGASVSLGGETESPLAAVDEEPPSDDDAGQDATQDLIAQGESPECPECSAMQLYYSEGCKTCEACGWSEC